MNNSLLRARSLWLVRIFRRIFSVHYVLLSIVKYSESREEERVSIYFATSNDDSVPLSPRALSLLPLITPLSLSLLYMDCQTNWGHMLGMVRVITLLSGSKNVNEAHFRTYTNIYELYTHDIRIRFSRYLSLSLFSQNEQQ